MKILKEKKRYKWKGTKRNNSKRKNTIHKNAKKKGKA